jgi:phosphoglycolate phosphatase
LTNPSRQLLPGTVRCVLFDLDGTLTDPVVGITTCIAHALVAMGAPCPPLEQLAPFVGPPLRPTFAGLLGVAETDPVVETAVAWYRERFSTVGLYENVPYPGIEEMLGALRSVGLQLFLATSKPLVFARRIVDHFGMSDHFSGVYGSELDGRFDDKAELIAHLLATERLAPAECVMVGDRSYDVIGAARNGVAAVGVTYGYGTETELREAGAAHVCHSVPDLLTFLRDLATPGGGIG